MKKLCKALCRHWGDVVMIGGGVCLVVGATLIAPWAGWLTAGALLIGGVVLQTMGGDAP